MEKTIEFENKNEESVVFLHDLLKTSLDTKPIECVMSNPYLRMFDTNEHIGSTYVQLNGHITLLVAELRRGFMYDILDTLEYTDWEQQFNIDLKLINNDKTFMKEGYTYWDSLKSMSNSLYIVGAGTVRDFLKRERKLL